MDASGIHLQVNVIFIVLVILVLCTLENIILEGGMVGGGGLVFTNEPYTDFKYYIYASSNKITWLISLAFTDQY